MSMNMLSPREVHLARRHAPPQLVWEGGGGAVDRQGRTQAQGAELRKVSGVNIKQQIHTTFDRYQHHTLTSGLA